MIIIFYLFLLIVFCFLLIKSTELLVGVLNKLSSSTHLEKFVLSSIVMGLATTLPELSVSLVAALENKENLALGNVLGSNIANLSIVIGGATLIGGSLTVSGSFLKKDFLAIFLATVLPLILLADYNLSRVDGLLLLLVFGAYNYTILKGSSYKKPEEKKENILQKLNHQETGKYTALVFLSAAAMLIFADVIVKISSRLAEELHLPLFLIGLFLVALGTSLPELTFQASAARKKQPAMVFGNLLGSLIANATFILGLAALLNPIKIVSFQKFFLATFFFIFIFFLFWFFIRTKKRLDRWEAVVLIAVYLIFFILEFVQFNH